MSHLSASNRSEDRTSETAGNCISVIAELAVVPGRNDRIPVDRMGYSAGITPLGIFPIFMKSGTTFHLRNISS